MVYVRGGAWTNLEDEILRAAVSKYGLNQWARVASLLARKTAAQVKARWTEWLDPRIDKREWTRAQDERLMYLARVMPNMWRSIGPMLRRTPAQAAERHQQLLLAGSAEADAEFAATAPEDVAIEAREALPDAVDMDEDELEMLAEARARIANTKGRKANRKERERYVEQQKRIEAIEARRAAKASGAAIVPGLHSKPSKFSVDYNAEVPFEHTPAAGPWDMSDEDARDAAARRAFAAELLASGKTFGSAPRADKSTDETEEKRLDALAARALSEHRAKRTKLVLPDPIQPPQPLHVAGNVLRAIEAEPTATRAVTLAQKFAELPPPKNEHSIVVPPMPSPPAESPPSTPGEADAEELDEQYDRELQQQTLTAVRQGLPIVRRVRLLSTADALDREVLEMLEEAESTVLPDRVRREAAEDLIADELSNEPREQPTQIATVVGGPEPTTAEISQQLTRLEAALVPGRKRKHALTDRIVASVPALQNTHDQLGALRVLAAAEQTGAAQRVASLRQQLSQVEAEASKMLLTRQVQS